MFTKNLSVPPFKTLRRGLLSYTGSVDLPGNPDVEVQIKGRSEENLSYAVAELQYISAHLQALCAPATDEFYGSYEGIRDALADGELENEGLELPVLSAPQEVWEHLVLEEIVIEPKSNLPIRLGFRAPWDVEHDLGLYLKDRSFQYAGTSV